MNCVDCGVEIFGKRSKQRCDACAKKRLSMQQKQWRENGKERTRTLHRPMRNSLTDKIYEVLTTGDKSVWEVSRLIGETESVTSNGVTLATFVYPDIYSYHVKRRGHNTEILGLVSNYQGSKLNGR